MKSKKFYYYSPNKLKLVPINNFYGRVLLFLSLFTASVILIVVALSNKYFSNNNNNLLVSQKIQIEKVFERELESLNQKYIKLANKFENITKKSNDLRLAVNLEPLHFNQEDFGVGGSKFTDLDETNLEFSGSKILTIYKNVNELEKNLNFETSNHEEITKKYRENLDLFDKLPAIKPVKSSLGDRFGMRYHPILKVRRMHHGLDFLSNTGEEVVAPGDGVITFVGNKGGYGKVVRINHGYGYETLYGHLSKFNVKRGQKVQRGDVIAISGNSGSLSTGPHLHYEVRHNGVCLNPRNFIFEETRLFEKDNDTFASK